MKCQICQETLDNGHPYKKHSIKLENYMRQFYPRNSLLTGEKIEWKNNIENYLLADFNNRNELKQYLKSHSKEENAHYLKELLLKLKEYKNITYIPTQVELRSRDLFPGINTFNNYFDYYKFCEEIGYKSRGFISLNKNSILKKERSLRGNPILIDSREQNLAKFNSNKEVKISTLNYADYVLEKDNYGIFFERKSLADYIGSMSAGFERLKNEIGRAQLNNDYIIMMVEDTLSNAMSFEYLPYISKKIQATSVFIAHRARELIQTFSNFQILFCDGRIDLVNKMRFIMEYGQNARNIDWELASNLKLFNDGI